MVEIQKKDHAKIMKLSYYQARHLACLEKGDEKNAIMWLKKLEEIN